VGSWKFILPYARRKGKGRRGRKKETKKGLFLPILLSSEGRGGGKEEEETKGGKGRKKKKKGKGGKEKELIIPSPDTYVK